MSNLNLNKYTSLAEYYADTRPVGEHNVSYIGNEYVIYDDEEMYDMQGNKIINWQNYLNFYMPNGGAVSLNKTGSPTVVELEYSLDRGQTWTIWQEDANGNRSLMLRAGQRMYVRNTSETQTGFSYYNNYYNFAFTDIVEADGNINSLLCKDVESITSLTAYCYNNLFKHCVSLVKSPELPSTSLSYGSYSNMFYNCTSLVTAPKLNATILVSECYYNMFAYCTSLVTAPELPATTLVSYCYYHMFYDCTQLKEVRTMMTNISAPHCLDSWLSGVAVTGDFYCPASLTIPVGSSGIPSGWTRHDI